MYQKGQGKTQEDKKTKVLDGGRRLVHPYNWLYLICLLNGAYTAHRQNFESIRNTRTLQLSVNALPRTATELQAAQLHYGPLLVFRIRMSWGLQSSSSAQIQPGTTVKMCRNITFEHKRPGCTSAAVYIGGQIGVGRCSYCTTTTAFNPGF